MIIIQENDFDITSEYNELSSDNSDGAIVIFVGKVRDFNQGEKINDLTLEHYPGMTEKVLNDLETEARDRFILNKVKIIHRIGKLSLGEQIVFIGVTSAHRKDAYNGCEFLIDFLKTKAPFWKLESKENGIGWVDANIKDQFQAKSWDIK